MRLLSSLAALVVLSASVAAHADTFSYQLLFQSDGSAFVAVDDYGDYVIQDQATSCANGGCYIAVIGGKTSGLLDTAPALPANPTSVAAGPGCNVTSAGYYTEATICTNGYEFLIAAATANSGFTSIYAASDPNTPLGIVDQTTGFKVTDNGSLYFTIGPNDYIGRVLDGTTTNAAIAAAVTPEQSTLLYLSTGVLAIAGLYRRRLPSSEDSPLLIERTPGSLVR